MAAERRFLVINPFGIGDVLFSTAMLRCLKNALPQARLYYLGNRKTAALLKSHPLIEDVVVYERDDFVAARRRSFWQWLKMFTAFIGRIRSLRCDTAIDLSLNTQYSFFAWLAGIRSRVGLDYKRRCRFLMKKLPITGYNEKHVAAYYLDVLNLIGIVPQPYPLEIVPDDQTRKWAAEEIARRGITASAKVIGIAPCGGDAFGKDAYIKRWPAEHYSQVIARLLDDPQVNIFIFAGPKEKQDVEAILQVVPQALRSRVFEFCDATLPQTVALVERCCLFISNDTGPLRFADGLGKKIIALFGPVDERVYGPYPLQAGRTVVLSRPLECRPCYRRFRLAGCAHDRRCLREISVEEVLKAARRLLENKG